jgi:hypothetical protein
MSCAAPAGSREVKVAFRFISAPTAVTSSGSAGRDYVSQLARASNEMFLAAPASVPEWNRRLPNYAECSGRKENFLVNSCGTDRSRGEKLWLECGMIGDVILCDRERDIPPGQKN